MAKAIIIMAIIATAYSAVIKHEDVQLQRIARSPCSTCGPPPPPPVLRTQNWSGLARSSDGLQNTVFSGAAAAADQGPLAAGEAFSLASSSAGAGFDRSANSGVGSNGAGIKGHYGGASGVQGSFSAHDGEHKVSGEGFKESHYSYHSGGRKEFNVQGLQQNGQTAASSSSSSAAQGGSFGSSNKDVAFGGNDGGHTRVNTNRGDVDVQETQNQNTFSGHKKNERFEGHGSSQQTYHESGRIENLGSGSSPGQTSSNSGSTGDADYSNLQYGSSNHQEDEESSFKGNGGKGHDRFESNISSGQETKQDNAFGRAAGKGSFGSESVTHDKGRISEFTSHKGGSHKHGQGFEASEGQSSSYGPAGFENGQYQESSGNQGQSQVSGSGGFGRGGYGSGSAVSNQQGYSRGSGTADAQSALSGALNLASQGLQTTGQAGCSTCGKNSYALSNAKSRSGSAVAVSIGG